MVVYRYIWGSTDEVASNENVPQRQHQLAFFPTNTWFKLKNYAKGMLNFK
jgi:hypothetical protein